MGWKLIAYPVIGLGTKVTSYVIYIAIIVKVACRNTIPPKKFFGNARSLGNILEQPLIVLQNSDRHRLTRYY